MTQKYRQSRLGIYALSGLLLLFACVTASAADFKSPKDCAVGVRVQDHENKSGTIVKVDSSMCQVKFADGKTNWYLFWMLRAAGASTVTDDKLVPGTYNCYTSSGNQLQYTFIDIIIDRPGSYHDNKGNRGGYRWDPPTGKIVFESGPFSKATSKLLPGPAIGMNMNGGTFFSTTCGLKKK
jgi:hypothetical protein